MPLSDDEQRILDELEATLAHDDPALAATLRARPVLPRVQQPVATVRDTLLRDPDSLMREWAAAARAARPDTEPTADAAPEATLVIDRETALGGLVLLVLGLVLLVAGLAVHPSVSVLGFVGMLCGTLRLVAAARPDAQPDSR